MHRDIKPENIMLRRDGFVKGCLGWAKLAEKNDAPRLHPGTDTSLVKTNPGVVRGTTAYMSPERHAG